MYLYLAYWQIFFQKQAWKTSESLTKGTQRKRRDFSTGSFASLYFQIESKKNVSPVYFEKYCIIHNSICKIRYVNT